LATDNKPELRPSRKKQLSQALEDSGPWQPPLYELADVTAIQSLARGDASPEMQQRALKWVIEQCAKTYDLSYRPGEGGDRDTVFAEGKRYVGLEIVKMLKVNPEFLRRKQE
jgi:hypothetical protein